jgi:excisionase family DNA binding protein
MHPHEYLRRKVTPGGLLQQGPKPKKLGTPRRGPHAKPDSPVAGAGPPLVDPREFGLVKAAYSVRETLELLSIGRTLLYRLVASGALRLTKLGKKTLFCASDIAQFLARLREAS